MKLPRWLVIGMLTSSVLAVLAAAGWWWVTWPERTAREFVELMASDKLPEAREMITLSADARSRLKGEGWAFATVPPKGWAEVKPQARSAAEILLATGKYRITRGSNWTFKVERGTITEPEIDIQNGSSTLVIIPTR